MICLLKVDFWRQTHTHTEPLLHWSHLSCCWCGRQLPAVVSDVCSNRLCFTICHHFNTRHSAVVNCREGRGVWLCSPFIRSVRWWIAQDYRWRWRWFISVILHAVDTPQPLISPKQAVYCLQGNSLHQGELCLSLGTVFNQQIYKRRIDGNIRL